MIMVVTIVVTIMPPCHIAVMGWVVLVVMVKTGTTRIVATMAEVTTEVVKIKTREVAAVRRVTVAVFFLK